MAKRSLLLILLGFSLPIFAATPAEECLVKQWEHIDLTDDVLTLFDEVKITKDADPHKVSDRAQTVLCRELGAVQPDLKQYWPSQTESVAVHTSEDIDDPTIMVFRQHGLNALEEIKRDYGVELAYPIHIILGYTKDGIWQAHKEAFPSNARKNDFDSNFDAVCSGSSDGGFAVYNSIVMCPLNVGQDYDPFQKFVDDSKVETAFTVESTFFHEFFHVAQNELMGDSWYCDVSSGRCKNNEAAWLSEGSAEFFMTRESYRHYWGAATEYAGYSVLVPSQLNQLNSDRAYNRNADSIYMLGQSAIYFLMMDHDKQTIVQFYKNMRKAATWEDAFEATFDESVEDFYVRFGELDKNVAQ